LRVLQWARANGCPWDVSIVLQFAGAGGGVEVLEWLQQHCGRVWTAAEMTAMLYEACSFNALDEAKWLRERGAEWPSSFYSYDKEEKSMISWSVRAVKWALANGCTWVDWQCQQLAPELCIQSDFKKDAVKLFALAHLNGCPCTCTRGVAAAAAAAGDEDD
jgi:hypothetical protein